MHLFTTIAGIRCYLEKHRPGVQVVLVPTMGALHAGHLSLVQQARRENKLVIVSIFVNPAQFGPTEDFNQYPRHLEQDRQVCEQAGVDVIFAPTAEEMNLASGEEAKNFTQVLPPAAMTSVLCGRYRPGHFTGVATVVTKLFNLIQPDRAYFGQKDAQQLAIIRRLVADLNFSVEVVACPTIRESSGLAMSSRNQYLTDAEKQEAAVLYRGLEQAQKVLKAGKTNKTALIEVVKQELATVPSLQVEYINLVDPASLTPLETIEQKGLLAIAARLGKTRLIDNILLRNRQPIIAIDGPAGAGKSTVTRRVAQALGLLYLDTGAMYRAVTWLVLNAGISLKDEPAIAELVSQSQIKLDASDEKQTQVRVWINDREVSQVIRGHQVTDNVSAIAALPFVRRQLVKQQQQIGKQGAVVAEGRDIGTHVFPDAELKIFLTASVQERANRRQQDLKKQGQPEISLEELQQKIQERDTKDSTRAVAPLRQAADAIRLDTDGLSIEDVTHQIISLYNQTLSG